MTDNDAGTSPGVGGVLSYAGFGVRLKAALIDFAVFLPLGLLSFWALGASWAIAIVVYVFNTVAYYAYSIIGHARWGQTIGKHVAKIRVRDLTGHPITWTHAWRRSSVDIALGTASLIIYAIVLARIPAADFEALNWEQISERYDAMRPWWARATEYLYYAWLGSEVVSVLFNRRRRALHDFVAGTVVVREGPVDTVAEPVVASLRGWRRALSVADRIMAGIALVAGGLFSLVALGAQVNADSATLRETLWLAAYAVVVGLAYALAARLLRRHNRWHWAFLATAVALTAIPILLLFTNRAA